MKIEMDSDLFTYKHMQVIPSPVDKVIHSIFTSNKIELRNT